MPRLPLILGTFGATILLQLLILKVDHWVEYATRPSPIVKQATPRCHFGKAPNKSASAFLA